jgi:hypothetical protein
MPAWTWKNTLYLAVLPISIVGAFRICSAQQTTYLSKGLVRVPFVGCKSDGQVGPAEPPNDTKKVIEIDPKLARNLAYYESGATHGVLAPRGWFCFGLYGSGGDELFVAPGPIDRSTFFAGNWRNLTGPAVEVDFRYGGTSGRDSVAGVIARVFPNYRAFVLDVVGLFDDLDLTYGPYPSDTLLYKGDRLVEFRTAPNSDGLGTITSRLEPNEQPIDGVATLVGEMPEVNLLLLSVRLPADLNALKPAIIQQLEREAAAGVSQK